MKAITSVTVVGAGATGGYLAAQLAKTGVSVTLVARGASLQEIRSHGILLEHPDGEREAVRPDRLGPRMTRCTARPSMIMGPYSGTGLADSSRVQELFSRAGIKCAVEPDASSSKWQKFLFNRGLNPLTAITGKRLGELLSHPATAEVSSMLLDEAATAALSAGAPSPADHNRSGRSG